MTPQQQAVLAQFGLSSWNLVSTQPSTETTDGPFDVAAGRATQVAKFPGAEQWIVSDGKGQTRTLTVKPPAAPPSVGAGTTDADAAYAASQSGGSQEYTVLDPPKDVPKPDGPAAETWTQQFTSTNGGVTTRYGTNSKTGKVEMIPGAPTETKPGATPADKLEQIKDPNTGKVVKLRDPSTNTIIDLPDGASTAKPSIVQGAGGAIYSWDGTNLTLKQAGTTPEAKPTEGQTRPNVAGGYSIQEVYRGGNWVTDPSVAPKPYDPKLAGAAKENDTRPNTDNKGQKIQEIFKGGSWVTDTSVAPTPFGAQAPTTLTTGTGPYIVQQDPTTGQTTNLPNPNTTDVAARVGQLQQAARAKSDELKQQVASGAKTAEQAAAEFDAFWATNIDPQSQQLAQAQQKDTFEAQTKVNQEQRYQEQQRAASLTTAQAAGQNAVKNATDFGQGIEQVGPGYGAALGNVLGAFSSGKAPGPIDGNSLTWQAPDMNDLATKATAAALAHISPTAAQIAGQPMPQVPQGLDVAGALQKSSYAPKTTIAPDGTVTIDHQPQPTTPPQATYPGGYQGTPLGFSMPNSYTPPAYSPAAPPF